MDGFFFLMKNLEVEHACSMIPLMQTTRGGKN